jgi:hypothetical protein
MSKLLEILNDPNYQNANSATKQAIFDKYAGQDDSYTSANEATKNAIQQKFGLGRSVPEPPKKDLDSSVLDVPVALGRGAVQGVRFIADAFGADNVVSKALRGTEDYLADLMSAQAKADSKEISRIMKEAEDKGVGDQVLAAIKALSIAPVDLLSQALGTAAPTIIGGLAGLAAKGGAATATAIGSGIGGTMGAGVVKSTIYDAVEDALIEAGERPEVAKARAEEAQNYTGENWGSILGGTALGSLAGVTGIEKNIVGRYAAKQASKEAGQKAVADQAAKQTIAGAAAREATPEFLQASQEQLAANLALQGEIDPRTNLPFDVPTFRGVAGQGALEGLLGAGLGAGVEATSRLVPEAKPAQPSTEETRDERELTVEERNKAQLARQALGADILNQVSGTIDADLANQDAETAAAIDAYNQSKKPPAPIKGVGQGTALLTSDDLKTVFTSRKPGKTVEMLQGVDLADANSREKVKEGLAYLFTKSKANDAQKKATLDLVNKGIAQGGAMQPFTTAELLGTTEEFAGGPGTPVTPPATSEVEPTIISKEQIDQMGVDEVTAMLAKLKSQPPLRIGQESQGPFDDTTRQALLARARELGIDTSAFETAAPAAEAVPERQVQLDDKGRIVFGTEEERSARRAEADELFNRVRQQYETMRQERFMVEEEEDLKEAKDVEEPETLSEEEAMKRQRALNRQLKKEAPELAKAELSQEAKDELALEEAERVYSEALKTNDPEQIVDAQRALQTLTKKEAPAKGKRKALPKWEKLTPDEKQVYLDGLSDPYDPINTALTNLIDYRELKSETTEVKSGDWNRQDAIAAYEINRSTEGRARNIAFPSWVNLSKAQRDNFLSAVEERSATEPSALAMRQGFAKLKESLIAEKGLRATGKKGDEMLLKEAQLRESETEAQKRVRLEEESKELSIDVQLPKNIIDIIKGEAGPTKPELVTKAVLDYLSKEAKGSGKYDLRGFGSSISSRLNKIVASTLSFIDLKTKLVYVDTDAFIAEYDAATDTIRVGNRGLSETALLHELVHAGTVKTISDVLSGKEKDPAKIEAVKRLKALMNESKKTLGNTYVIDKNGEVVKDKDGRRLIKNRGKFSRAYQNIYEFIAYAMSDPKFQTELRKISVPERLIKYTDISEDAGQPQTLYEEFVRTVADVLGLFRRYTRAVLIKTGLKNIFKMYDPLFIRRQDNKIEKDAENIDLDEAELEEIVSEPKVSPENNKLIKEADQLYKKYSSVVQDIKKVEETERVKFEQDFKKETGKAPKGKDFDGLLRLTNITTNKLRQQQKQIETEIKSLNENLKDAGLIDFEIDLTEADQKIGDYRSVSPGYLGNLFLELAGVFDTIVAAPPEGGMLITRNDPSAPLRIGKKAPATGSVDQQVKEARERLTNRTESADSGAFKKFGSIVGGIFTKQGYNNLVRSVQNRLVDFEKKERELDRLGKLVMIGTDDEINDINTEYNSAMGIAQNKSNLFKEFVDGAIDSLRIIMDKTGKSYAEVLTDMQLYMTGLHDMERRLELFYRNAPLNDSAATERQKIYEELYDNKLTQLRKTNEKAADTVIKGLKQRLIKLTTDPNNYTSGIDPEKTTPAGSMYNPLGYDLDVALKFKDLFKDSGPEVKAELEKLFGTASKPGLLKQVIDKSAELNAEANYFTDAVQNVISFYDYKHYFPFKGKGTTAEAAKLDEVDPFISERLGGDFKQGEPTFMGRQTDADNPFLQVFTEATKSSMRAGFKSVPHAMKNLINTKEVAGSKKATVTFAERSAPGFKWSEVSGQFDFFVYKPDGSVDIYEINDPNMRRAFKGLYQPDQPLVDLANRLTSTIGSFHTRYNPAFAPLDFVRNLMTYAGIVGLRYGPKTAGQLYASMAGVVGKGGMHKTFIFSKAFGEGDQKKLNQLKKSGDKFYEDVARYYELGGQVAYMDSLTNSQALESLGKELRRNPKFSPKKWNNYFDSWMSMFETTSRIATFRTLRDKFIAEKIPREEAEKRAMSVAKDLANFQQVGEAGRTLGALFMFWRPAATGAIKAIDALLPAFNNKTRQELIDFYKTKPNVTDAQAQRAADVFLTEVKNARVMGFVLGGAGFFAYTMAHMMAGEDDEGRNKAATDDMARWVRFARFNTGIEVAGRDVVFQTPWGFGPGAIASAGAQMAAVAYGGQDLMRAGLNIASAGFESFVPLPISKIDPTANPTLFIVDSIMPSVLRPLVQFSANTDGLGRKIYTDRQSRYADAYLGGDNVPEMYKDVVRYMFEATNGAIDMSPGTAYFFANNYVDGVSRALATTYNLTDVVRGQKEFDIRTDTFLLDSYFKAPANYDAIQFSKAEGKIKELDKRFKALQGSPGMDTFLEENPMAPGVVAFYNKTVNGALRNLRAQANYVRRSDMSQKEKNELLQQITKQQNQIKRAFVTAIEGLETGYTGYEE